MKKYLSFIIDLIVLYILVLFIFSSSGEAVMRTNQQAGGEDPSIVLLNHHNLGQGTTTWDVSGNNNNGDIISGIWVDGLWGKTLDFDGDVDYVEIPDSPELSAWTSGSWAFWFKTTAQFDNYVGLLSKKFANPAGAIEWQVYTLSDKIRIDIGGGSDYRYRHTIKIDDELANGEWWFYVATWNGGNSGTDINIYLNGILDNGTSGIFGTPTTIDDTGSPLYIALQHSDPYTFDGIIEEVILFRNRVLTAVEIKYMYQRQSVAGQ